MKPITKPGDTFGRLTVVSFIENGSPYKRWLCKCSCGNLKEAQQDSLRRGNTKSCGCLRDDLAKQQAITNFSSHGDTQTRLYKAHNNMLTRCYNPDTPYYKNYGAKGIRVYTAWLQFEAFRDWALTNGYTNLLTIDRIEGNKDYSPENCRWVSMETQQRNKPKRAVTCTSKYLGVTARKGSSKWLARITVSKKTIHLGTFDSEEQAAQARDTYIISNNLKDFVMNLPTSTGDLV